MNPEIENYKANKIQQGQDAINIIKTGEVGAKPVDAISEAKSMFNNYMSQGITLPKFAETGEEDYLPRFGNAVTTALIQDTLNSPRTISQGISKFREGNYYEGGGQLLQGVLDLPLPTKAFKGLSLVPKSLKGLQMLSKLDNPIVREMLQGGAYGLSQGLQEYGQNPEQGFMNTVGKQTAIGGAFSGVTGFLSSLVKQSKSLKKDLIAGEKINPAEFAKRKAMGETFKDLDNFEGYEILDTNAKMKVNGGSYKPTNLHSRFAGKVVTGFEFLDKNGDFLERDKYPKYLSDAMTRGFQPIEDGTTYKFDDNLNPDFGIPKRQEPRDIFDETRIPNYEVLNKDIINYITARKVLTDKTSEKLQIDTAQKVKKEFEKEYVENGLFLDDILDHDELYKIYPDARSLNVIFYNPEKSGGSVGFVNPDLPDFMFLNTSLMTEGLDYDRINEIFKQNTDAPISTTIHEVQHYLDRQGGRAPIHPQATPFSVDFLSQYISKDKKLKTTLDELTKTANEFIELRKQLVGDTNEFKVNTKNIDESVDKLKEDLFNFILAVNKKGLDKKNPTGVSIKPSWLFADYLTEESAYLNKFYDLFNNEKSELRVMGDWTVFPNIARQKINQGEEITATDILDFMRLNMFDNYKDTRSLNETYANSAYQRYLRSLPEMNARTVEARRTFSPAQLKEQSFRDTRSGKKDASKYMYNPVKESEIIR